MSVAASKISCGVWRAWSSDWHVCVAQFCDIQSLTGSEGRYNIAFRVEVLLCEITRTIYPVIV